MFNFFRKKDIEQKEARVSAMGLLGDARYIREDIRELRERLLAIENYLGIRINKRWRAEKIRIVKGRVR